MSLPFLTSLLCYCLDYHCGCYDYNSRFFWAFSCNFFDRNISLFYLPCNKTILNWACSLLETSTKTVRGLACDGGGRNLVLVCRNLIYPEPTISGLFLSLDWTCTTFDLALVLRPRQRSTVFVIVELKRTPSFKNAEELTTFDSAIFLCNCVHILFHRHWWHVVALRR